MPEPFVEPDRRMVLANELKRGVATIRFLRDFVRQEYASLPLDSPLCPEVATVLALTPLLTAAMARLSKQIPVPRPRRGQRIRR